MCTKCKEFRTNKDYRYCPICGEALIYKQDISTSQAIHLLHTALNANKDFCAGYTSDVSDKLVVEIKGNPFLVTLEEIVPYIDMFDYLKTLARAYKNK